MSERAESLLVLTTDRALSMEARERLSQALAPIADSLGAKPLVLSEGMQAGIHSDIRPVMDEMLAEQRKTNMLLSALIEAMAEEGGDPDAEQSVYLDGSKVR